MINRQLETDAVDCRDAVFLKDIHSSTDATGLMASTDHLVSGQALMCGRFYSQTFADGISMHVADVVEQQDIDSRSVLLPGLSVNVIFEGQSDYSFSHHRYRLETINDPLCSVIINDRQEVMTRHMSAGRSIQTMNVCVQREWLEKRCTSVQDKRQIQRLLDSPQVLSWRPSDSLLALAQQLWWQPQPQVFSQRLESEQRTLKFLATLLEELEIQLDHRPTECLLVEPVRSSLKSRVDEQLALGHGLREIAAKLNMSERTLQRKFKTLYQQTVASYVKRKRLEQAKKNLVIEKLSVNEAAYLAGYNHSSNFVSAFKREYGITPTEFMDRHRYQLTS